MECKVCRFACSTSLGNAVFDPDASVAWLDSFGKTGNGTS